MEGGFGTEKGRGEREGETSASWRVVNNVTVEYIVIRLYDAVRVWSLA